MSYRDGQKVARRQGPMPGRAQRGPGPKNGTAPIGSLVIQQNGQSKFYPEGGRDPPPSRRAVTGPRHPRRAREPSPDYRGKEKPPRVSGSQNVYFNTGFNKASEHTELPIGMAPDDDSSVASGHFPRETSAQVFVRSFILCCCVSVIVAIIIGVAIIFPVIYIASTSSGPSVTGTIRLNTTFLNVYDDVASSEYTSLVTDFTTAMNQIFQNSPTYSNDFTGTSVTDLEAGPTSTTSTTEVSFTLTFNKGTDITPVYRNNLFVFITVETTKAGTPFVSAIDVVTGTLRITDSCNVVCLPGRQLDTTTCRCA